MQPAELRSFIGNSTGWEIGWVDCPCETIVPIAYHDADGDRLHGKNDYVLRFSDGKLPPARHWRISLYDVNGFFCENSLWRYGIGNVGNGFLLNMDYSLTLYIQHASPGPLRETVWLPAPRTEFFILLRMHQPDARKRGAYCIPSIYKAV